MSIFMRKRYVALGIMFDIDTVEWLSISPLYGLECYKKVFYEIPLYFLNNCYFFMGDVDSDTCCIAIESEKNRVQSIIDFICKNDIAEWCRTSPSLLDKKPQDFLVYDGFISSCKKDINKLLYAFNPFGQNSIGAEAFKSVYGDITISTQ